jgi:uncharacterized protein YjbI with pentapeptide repeats
MANPEHLTMLKQGVKAWNEWRLENPQIRPDLSNSQLRELKCAEQTISNERTAVDFNDVNLFAKELYGANFGGASLSGAYLTRAYLATANFHNANLHHAYLRGANLTGANLVGADLSEADFLVAELYGANFGGASLRGAYLGAANFSAADLKDADLAGAYMNGTRVAACDLSNTKGLEAVVHGGPSSIGIDTLYISHGKIPDKFLRGAGVPDELIVYARSLVNKPFDYYSCFISHSEQDRAFAERLRTDLAGKSVRCYLFSKDAKWGETLWGEIDRGIKSHDKLVVVCSENSLQSPAVLREIERALQREDREKKNVLFPIRLDDYIFEGWEHERKADVVKKVAGDFRDWENQDTYQEHFGRLLKDLRAEDSKKA